MRQKKASRAEMDVLREVMERQPVTVREVADAMAAKKGVALTTVQTLLGRLVTKGLLKRQQADGAWRYSLTGPRPEVERSLVDDFVETVLGGSLSPFVAYLNDRNDLKPEEAQALRDLMERLDKEGQ
ncbi:MAG: BlaI/MecI/CopY family transcriptional regulator [Armatimonadetes bacterium]|nr:BlaI/MecI/CopY family transcriptional regulator [Armatimonadota bacterium]